VKDLVRGKRHGTPGTIRHAKIELTTKGEREAMKVKNPPREIVFETRSFVTGEKIDLSGQDAKPTEPESTE
jgi:hypothetical protein